MRSTLMALIGSGLLVLGSATGRTAAAADKETTGFFNGKDLDGWEGLTEYWSVKRLGRSASDAALVGNTGKDGIKFNTFLCSKKKYGDFELSFQVRLANGKGNSGVQIRSEILDMKKYTVKGPQCDIGQQFWGSLYGEHFGGMMKAAPEEVVKEVLKPDDFNDYYIKCVGKHVTIKLNGKTTVDDDFAKMPETGIIAWQLHQGGPMEVTFKNLKFRQLGNE
ncbi:MAG: DUF1080 domain-containing protein [Planctomycetes bacterium]|nr:DUF1080 domain-containing protein [Planctomycetota bacterium]